MGCPMGFPSLVRTGTAGTPPATLDIAAVPARTAMVPSGRQAATKAASRFRMIGRARRARRARMATVQHRLKCSVERQSPSYRRDGDRKSERDERTAGEACSGQARGLAGGLLVRGVGVPRTGHPQDHQPPWLAVSQRRTGFFCLKRRCWSEAEAGATWRVERQSSGCDDHVMSARQIRWRQLNNERRGRLVSTQATAARHCPGPAGQSWGGNSLDQTCRLYHGLGSWTWESARHDRVRCLAV